MIGRSRNCFRQLRVDVEPAPAVPVVMRSRRRNSPRSGALFLRWHPLCVLVATRTIILPMRVDERSYSFCRPCDFVRFVSVLEKSFLTFRRTLQWCAMLRCASTGTLLGCLSRAERVTSLHIIDAVPVDTDDCSPTWVYLRRSAR